MSTFLTLQQELGAQVGLDQTVSDDATLLKRWLNNSQQMIFQSWSWPFLRASTPLVVQTVADITGTASIASGGLNFTDSSFAIGSGNVGSFIKFDGSPDWFRITAFSAPNFPTIEAAYTGETSLTASYTVRKVFYSTSSAVDRILSIRQSVTPFQLGEASKEGFEQLLPFSDESGTPRSYRMAGYDSSSVPQFILFPSPDAAVNLYVDYLRAATDMSADGDVSIIPAKWHTTVLLQGAKCQAFDFLDDTRLKDAWKLFYIMVEEMKKTYQQSQSLHRVMRAVDEQPVTHGFPQLPEHYPRSGY